MTEAAHPLQTSATFISVAEVPPLRTGTLDGWRLAVKDNIDVGGLRTTGGTRYLADHVATRDAETVRRVRGAGATIVGKTNLHELGHGITGINPTFGTTRHPADPHRTVGGSSGGSALAVLEGHARAALGTDTGGSVRIPAAFTGLVGFRPSAGRYSSDGVMRISPTRDTVGVLARTVADAAALDGVLAPASDPAGGGGGANSARIGVLAEARAGLSPSLAVAFESAVSALRDAGMDIIELDRPRHLDDYFSLGLTVLQAETIDALEAYLGSSAGSLEIHELIRQSESPDVREILSAAVTNPVAGPELRAARAELHRLDLEFLQTRAEAGVGAVVYPTTSVEPPLVSGPVDGDVRTELQRTVQLSTPATLAGTPAISIPAGVSRETGLPVGLALEHVRGADAELLRIAERASAALRNAK